MTEIAEVAGDLGLWMPRVAVLIAQPDTEAASGGAHQKPGSRLPGNPAAWAAFFDAHALVREILGVFQVIVYGHSDPIPWSDAATEWALERIVSLSYAVPHDHVKRAGRDMAHAVTVSMQLPAHDEAETPRRLPAECRYCHGGMLWVYPREGKVACLNSYGDDGRFGACRDTNGERPIGFTDYDHLGNPCIKWADGLVT